MGFHGDISKGAKFVPREGGKWGTYLGMLGSEGLGDPDMAQNTGVLGLVGERKFHGIGSDNQHSEF